MDRLFYRELWSLRFARMLELEQASVAEYRGLLEECRRLDKNHPILAHLQTLVNEENKHVKLVEELLSILERQRA